MLQVPSAIGSASIRIVLRYELVPDPLPDLTAPARVVREVVGENQSGDLIHRQKRQRGARVACAIRTIGLENQHTERFAVASPNLWDTECRVNRNSIEGVARNIDLDRQVRRRINTQIDSVKVMN